ncbi:DUF2867 domain-containing protein [Paucibacter sp. M5-1]|uniref:DUF2867 domain-containing protein n=1 Tax=Paucibacter sp. M5-1 TaxID=3015998 RepID=UPI0022B866B3|nr:DUF2867 domain-containing protein [Paucibacter sp. M5-1]MCZ7882074.1 DUF2867 domain-containing protein [Paucibacter sp. M5-1]
MPNAPRRVSPPADSVLAADYGAAHLADAFAIALPDGVPSDADALTLARSVLAHPPRWMRALLAIRDALVKPFGLKTTAAMREHLARSGVAHVDIFRLLSARPQEAVFGEMDRHLDFKLSILLRPVEGFSSSSSSSPRREVVATTVVHCHNVLGRAYLALILPGHVLVVRSLLAEAVRRYPGGAEDRAQR